MATISIHRALTELKTIDDRIKKGIESLMVVSHYQKTKKIAGVDTVEEFTEKAKAKLESVEALINRKQLIKKAIVKANAETIVKVCGKEMTIADAITKKSIIELKVELSNRLKRQWDVNLAEMNRKNDVVNQNLQNVLIASLGKDNVKSGSADVENISVPFLETNEFNLADPIKLKEYVESLDTEILDFKAEIDSVLSEINAITMIEIE